MTISQERLINWAKETLAILAEIHDPENFQRKCKNCHAEVHVFRGRHSRKLLARHPRMGCRPSGDWMVQEEAKA